MFAGRNVKILDVRDRVYNGVLETRVLLIISVLTGRYLVRGFRRAERFPSRCQDALRNDFNHALSSGVQ
jgi:hypothetical protein